jgi:uncharacterized membrane protein
MNKRKNIMWHIKSICEIAMILIFIVCLMGFIGSLFILIWNRILANNIMGWSVGIGFVNFLFLISCDKDWRQDYMKISQIG